MVLKLSIISGSNWAQAQFIHMLINKKEGNYSKFFIEILTK